MSRQPILPAVVHSILKAIPGGWIAIVFPLIISVVPSVSVLVSVLVMSLTTLAGSLRLVCLDQCGRSE
jgi:hypothetical protein